MTASASLAHQGVVEIFADIALRHGVKPPTLDHDGKHRAQRIGLELAVARERVGIL
jgi:hypothetical protein